MAPIRTRYFLPVPSIPASKNPNNYISPIKDACNDSEAHENNEFNTEKITKKIAVDIKDCKIG